MVKDVFTPQHKCLCVYIFTYMYVYMHVFDFCKKQTYKKFKEDFTSSSFNHLISK